MFPSAGRAPITLACQHKASRDVKCTTGPKCARTARRAASSIERASRRYPRWQAVAARRNRHPARCTDRRGKGGARTCTWRRTAPHRASAGRSPGTGLAHRTRVGTVGGLVSVSPWARPACRRSPTGFRPAVQARRLSGAGPRGRVPVGLPGFQPVAEAESLMNSRRRSSDRRLGEVK